MAVLKKTETKTTEIELPASAAALLEHLKADGFRLVENGGLTVIEELDPDDDDLDDEVGEDDDGDDYDDDDLDEEDDDDDDEF